jgi:hypothetical protein
VDDIVRLALPGPVRAAAADGARVWCATGGRLVAYEPFGSVLLEAPEPAGLRSLAVGPDVVAAALEPGMVAWLDPSSGIERQRRPVGGDLDVVAGGGGVWALDRRSRRAWRLVEDGVLAEPVVLAGVDQLAPDGDRVWWTSRDDTLLRGGSRPVDLGVGAGARGGMTVCAGSVWVSVTGGLLRVGAWGAELGPTVPAPEGPVRHLVCAGGVLAGGSGRRGLFVLDPSIDVDVRHLPVDLGGELDFLIATHSLVWAMPAARPEARLLAVRPVHEP